MLAFVALGAALAVSLFRWCAAESALDRERRAREALIRQLRDSGHLERLEEITEQIRKLRESLEHSHDLHEGKR